MRVKRALGLIGLGCALASASLVGAVPAKKAPAAGAKPAACGARVLPLAEGTSWTYVLVPAPYAVDREIGKLAPRAAKKVVITVKAVDAKGADTVVSLEEKVTYELAPEDTEKKTPPVMSDVVVKSTITCNAKTKFEISPDSFFFSGEPGGYHELAFSKFERSKDTSLKLANGALSDTPWREDIVASFQRKPGADTGAKLTSGKLELERSFTPERHEDITTPLAKYTKTEKVALVTTGRVTLDATVSPNQKPSELPAGWITRFWFAPDVGLIQSLNTYVHKYQLTEFTQK